MRGIPASNRVGQVLAVSSADPHQRLAAAVVAQAVAERDRAWLRSPWAEWWLSWVLPAHISREDGLALLRRAMEET